MPDATQPDRTDDRAARWAREAAEGAAEAARLAPYRAIGRWGLIGVGAAVAIALVGGLIWFFIPNHGPHETMVSDVGVGTCFPGDPDDEVHAVADVVTTVDCSRAHRAEAFSSRPLAPNMQVRCEKDFKTWPGSAQFDPATIIDTFVLSGAGQRSIVLCVAVAPAT